MVGLGATLKWRPVPTKLNPGKLGGGWPLKPVYRLARIGVI